MPDVVPLLSPGSRGLLDSLAVRLGESGLVKFEGTLWVDGSLFARADPPRGWAVEDLPRGYGAPVTALMANGNAASVVAAAGSSGGVSVTLDPPDAPLTLAGTVDLADSGAAAWLHADRAPGTRLVRVAGAVPRHGVLRRTVSLPEPDSAAAVMLLGAMRRAGIEVKARVRPDAAELRERGGLGAGTGAESPAAADGASAAVAAWRAVGGRRFTAVASLRAPAPSEVVAAVAAYSLNPEAEALLRLLDPAPSRKSPDPALRELRGMLLQAGVDSTDVALADGSGLSPQNLVTARAMVRWLAAMDGGTRLAPGEFAGLLPIPGSRGTLERRFRDLGSDSLLHAKTGTLTNVSSLCGHVTARSGERIAFAFLSNGNARSVAPARAAEEALVALLAGFERGAVAPPHAPAWRIPR
jgi:D-alanyl-D-alanine carboxypeptidase/D-alanyl-D-alanine-endopeptidase (penicillin-binding protein 4)